MRRSIHVTAPLLAAAALTFLTACKRQEPQRCVDEHDNVVDDKFCQNLPANQQQHVEQRPDGHGGFVPFIFPMYRYYYGGIGGYGIGSHLTGGGYAPISGHSYSRGGISRGGFGSSFSSHGGSTGG